MSDRRVDRETTAQPVERGWCAPRPIDDGGNEFDGSSRVALNRSGDGFVAWVRRRGAHHAVWARRVHAVMASGPPELVAAEVGSFDLAVGSNGDAVIVWSANNRDSGTVHASRYSARSGWSAPSIIGSAMVVFTRRPAAAVDSGGNALVAWLASDGSSVEIQANRYVVGSGWQVPAGVRSDPWDAYSVAAGFDSSDRAIIVWHQRTALSSLEVRAIWYASGSGWSAPELVGPHGTNPRLANGSAGELALAYVSQGVIFVARYHPTAGWALPQRIESPGTVSQSPALAIHDESSAVMIFCVRADSEDRHRIATSHYEEPGEWGPAAILESEPGGVQRPSLAASANGDAFAIWNRDRTSVWASRFDRRSGWGAPVQVGTGRDAAKTDAGVAVDASGNALAVWDADGGPMMTAYR